MFYLARRWLKCLLDTVHGGGGDGRGGEFGTIPHHFIHFRLCSESPDKKKKKKKKKTTARSNLHTDTNHAGKSEGRLESLMHPSFLDSSESFCECRQHRIKDPLGTASQPRDESQISDFLPVTLEHGARLVLIKWFPDWRIHLDAFRRTSARRARTFPVDPSPTSSSLLIRKEVKDVEGHTGEVPELGRPSWACCCGRRLHCRAEGGT